MTANFAPPEYISGCTVQDVTDIDDYATNNGWIEALCGKHNQQRVRYKGVPANVAVNDVIDVLYFPESRAFESIGQGGTVAPPPTSSSAPTIIVNNGSGSAASANDVGYIDANGDYQTTTTANFEADWCVVIQGGANGSDIYVARRGRVTVAYAGSAPSDGDFLVTSTTAGSASASSTMRPEIFARCLAAGSGGTVSAILLTQRKFYPIIDTDNLLRLDAASDSDFVATIATAGVSSNRVYHDPPSSGTQANVTPQATTELAKIVLHNTTRTEEAFIEAAGTDATDDYIDVTDAADVSGWVATDAIVARSQTNTSTGGGRYFFDLDLAEDGTIPELATSILVAIHDFTDTSATGELILFHPYEANDNPKRQRFITVSTGGEPGTNFVINLLSRRFCVFWGASGSGTVDLLVLRLRGIWVAAP